jgi:hypothetical protein
VPQSVQLTGKNLVQHAKTIARGDYVVTVVGKDQMSISVADESQTLSTLQAKGEVRVEEKIGSCFTLVLLHSYQPPKPTGKVYRMPCENHRCIDLDDNDFPLPIEKFLGRAVEDVGAVVDGRWVIRGLYYPQRYQFVWVVVG